MRAATVLYVLFLALLLAQAAAYLPQITGPLPAHFGPDGRPDAWTDRGGMVAITAGLALLATFIGFILPRLLWRLPREWIQMPRRDEWLSTPAGAERVAARMTLLLRVVATATLGLFLAIQQGMYPSALRSDPHVKPAVVLGCVVAYLVVIAVSQIAMIREFRRGPPERHSDVSTRVYSAGRVEPRRH